MAGGTPREIELKLELAPDDLERLRAHPILAQNRRGSGRSKTLESVYFDTDRLAVRRSGLSLRVRRAGARRIQTVKADAAGAGMFDRAEWEREIQGDLPDLAAAAETALEPLLDEPEVREGLRPVFATHVDRTVYTVGDADWQVELTLDRGMVRAGDRSAPLCEVELELKRGQPGDLFRLARQLAEVVPLRLGVRSKSERGYELLQERRPAPVKAEPLHLRPETGTAEAFQVIGRSCLRQLGLNEPVLLGTRDPDALHQMRVALRRLRAALSLFKGVVADERVAAVKAELRWAAGQLGDARNLDVFVSKVLAKAKARHPDEPGFAELEAHFSAERAAAYDLAFEAVRSTRFRTAVLEAAAWLEAGPWLLGGDAAAQARRAAPIGDFAAAVLKRRRGKVRRLGKHLADLDAPDRHRVRIQVKKLRYAAQFFASLYETGKARKRRDAFLAALEDLQEHLGDLNDIAVGHEMQSALTRMPAADGDEEAGRRRAFAAGFMAGEQAARAEGLLAAAAAAYAGVAAAKPFWKAG